MDLTFRKALPGDEKTICEVHNAAVMSLSGGHYPDSVLKSWSDGMTIEAALRAILKPGLLAKICLFGEELSGFGFLEDFHVRAVYVHPDFQSVGIGGSILHHLEQAAASAGHNMVDLEASLNAKPFYLSNGYEPISKGTFIFKDGVSMDCVRMSKKIE